MFWPVTSSPMRCASSERADVVRLLNRDMYMVFLRARVQSTTRIRVCCRALARSVARSAPLGLETEPNEIAERRAEPPAPQKRAPRALELLTDNGALRRGQPLERHQAGQCVFEHRLASQQPVETCLRQGAGGPLGLASLIEASRGLGVARRGRLAVSINLHGHVLWSPASQSIC